MAYSHHASASSNTNTNAKLIMDWQAFALSLQLAICTVLCLQPVAILLARYLATSRSNAKHLLEAVLLVPLILPPTVLGFYLLGFFATDGWFGGAWQRLFGEPLVFSFSGLLLASIFINIPFAVQPALRSFASISHELREAAATCGLSKWQGFLRIELPLAWPGIVTAMVLTFAHTLGEFGVVLMVGGNIPGETRTLAIAIYDSVQRFDNASATTMAALLLGVSLFTISITLLLGRRIGQSHGKR